MKWKTGGVAIGTRRVAKRFAFWPVTVKEGNTVWLEFYEVHQVRIMHPDGPFGVWMNLGNWSSFKGEV